MIDPKTFRCERCGECCKKLYVILSDDDIKSIENLDYLIDNFSEVEGVGEFKGKRALKKKDGQCVFLIGENTCKIYNSRPEICKKYPFFGKELESCKP